MLSLSNNFAKNYTESYILIQLELSSGWWVCCHELNSVFSLFFIKNNEVPFFLMVDTLFDLGMVLFVIGSCEEKR